jgi:catalase
MSANRQPPAADATLKQSINRPIMPVHNNRHDGFARQTLNQGPANYLPNSLGEGFPKPKTPVQGGYACYAERIAGHVIRERSPSFKDHFASRARPFHRRLGVRAGQDRTRSDPSAGGRCAPRQD